MKNILKKVVSGFVLLILAFQTTFATIPLEAFITQNDEGQIFWGGKPTVLENWKFVSKFSKDGVESKTYESCDVNGGCFDPDNPGNADLSEDGMFFTDATYGMELYKCPAGTYGTSCEKTQNRTTATTMQEAVNACSFQYEENGTIKDLTGFRPMDVYEWYSLSWDDETLKTQNKNLIKKYFTGGVQLGDGSLEVAESNIVKLKDYQTTNDIICVKDNAKPLIDLPKIDGSDYLEGLFTDGSRFSDDDWVITATTATNLKIGKSYSLLSWGVEGTDYTGYSAIDTLLFNNERAQEFLKDKGFNNTETGIKKQVLSSNNAHLQETPGEMNGYCTYVAPTIDGSYACAGSEGFNIPDYTKLDYTKLDYTKLDYTKLDYTKLDYTKIDYTQIPNWNSKAQINYFASKMPSNGVLDFGNGYKIRKDTCASDSKCILYIPSSNILVSSGDKQTSGAMPNASTCGDNGGACSTCYDMNNGGLGGNNSGFWKLPPRDGGGLSDLYTNKAKLNNISSIRYWSSTFHFLQDNNAYWRVQRISGNGSATHGRTTVRPIRCTASL